MTDDEIDALMAYGLPNMRASSGLRVFARAVADAAINRVQAEQDAFFDAYQKKVQRAESERDAAMALLRECREQFALGYAAWRDELPLVERIDALLGDGGEA